MYKRYQPTHIWREMDRFQRDLNRLFDDYSPSTHSAPSFPAANIWADAESVLITAEMPGMRGEDIDLNILEDNLTISGERPTENLPEGATYHRQERGFGKFARSVRLPYRVDAKKVKANFKNGILEVSLPRAEEDRPKKIAIKVA